MTAAQVMGTYNQHAEDKIGESNKKPTNIKTLKTCFQKYKRVKEFKYLGTI